MELNSRNPASQRPDMRTLTLCLVAAGAAMLAVWPFAEIGYGDDTAYAHVALVLSRTGHIVYNGWESAFLLLHAYWGAMFIRLFGFSFALLRLSTIPFALGAVGLCYALVRRAGLQAKASVLVTLLFGLSPLFLPVAVSYMTDVPALFFTFFSLYSFARAEEAPDMLGSGGWLVLGTIAGFLGGTSRQVVWLVPLVVLPYFAGAKRSRKRQWISALLACVFLLIGIVCLTKWFNSQQYSIFQPSLSSELKLAARNPFWIVNMTARLGLMLLLVILPAAVPLFLRALLDTRGGPRARQIFVAALLALLFVAIAIHPSLASFPWIASTLNWQGVNGDAPLPERPLVLAWPIRAVVALAVYITACLLLSRLFKIRPTMRRAYRAFIDPSGESFTLGATSLFSIAYFVLLVVRSAGFDIFDRYLLPIMPFAATLLLLWFNADNPEPEPLRRRAMPFSWALLAVLAFYGIAGTQDYWSLARARVLATEKLEAAGVPRTAIDAGFEYNAWTELQINGRLNSRWVINPPGAYRPGLSQTPSVVPQYRLEYKPNGGTAPSEFGSVPYFSLLPPFHKRVSIDRVVAPSTSN